MEYMCEAKMLETNRDDDLEVCHVPFRLNNDPPGTWHYGCAQTMNDTGNLKYVVYFCSVLLCSFFRQK